MASQNSFTESTGKPLLVIAKVRNKSTGTFLQMGKIEELFRRGLIGLSHEAGSLRVLCRKFSGKSLTAI